jgi:tRNA threonylcarbamoyladenosine biosynthesis protein TsaE
MTAATLLTLPLADAEATTRLGHWFAAHLKPGDVLLLAGQIGAGKTHFARSLIQKRLADAGLHEDVPSPTFTLVQTYDDDLAEIWHADLYRLTHPDEAAELGLDEAFETAICLIEWPDRLGDLTPKSALRLEFTLSQGGYARDLVVSGPASWAERIKALANGI